MTSTKTSRSNNSSIGPNEDFVETNAKEEMAAYDELPPSIRQKLAYASRNYSAKQALEILKKRKRE